ncbi:hypothetical protein [Streptomyces sp. NBC_01373]|uniref:hypothetical protein n=1 Tax=Streptomyces sp. NBC_01373 TaxID=2903843 RepID=UPI0022537091|nr:hypothetical protein [Streptomyces sp. NBC_01373]MCX4698899.1 hypothetical protein [Streptomyces sp. NBC_01373]
MHDSLDHELSPIALRAGALQVAADATDRLPASSASCARATGRCRRLRRARASSNSWPARPSRGCRCTGNRREPVRPYNRLGRRTHPAPGGARGADERGAARSGRRAKLTLLAARKAGGTTVTSRGQRCKGRDREEQDPGLRPRLGGVLYPRRGVLGGVGEVAVELGVLEVLGHGR